MQPFSGTENSSFIITNGSQRDSRKFCQDLAEYLNVSFLYETRNRRCVLRRRTVLQDHRLWVLSCIFYIQRPIVPMPVLVNDSENWFLLKNKDKHVSYKKFLVKKKFHNKWKKGSTKLSINWYKIANTLENLTRFEISPWKQRSWKHVNFLELLKSK